MNLLTPTIKALNYLKINYVLSGTGLYGLVKHNNITKYSKSINLLLFKDNPAKMILLFIFLLKNKLILKPKFGYSKKNNRKTKFFKITGKPTLITKSSNNIQIHFLNNKYNNYEVFYQERILYYDCKDLSIENIKSINHNNQNLFIPQDCDEFIIKYKENLFAGFNKVYEVDLAEDQQYEALDLLDGTVSIIKENKSKYFLDAGTLLGAVRDKKFIPWDHDIDLGIIYNNQMEIDKLIKLLKKKYYVRALKFKNDPDIWNLGKYRIIKVYKKKGLFSRDTMCLDIFIFYLSTIDATNQEVYKYGVWNKNAFYPKSILTTFTTIKFYNKYYCIPNNPENFLKFKYGDNWETPNKKWSTVLNDKSLINNNSY